MKEHDAGPEEAAREAGATLVPLAPKDRRPRQAIVVFDDAGQPRAYLNECKHLPVPLDGGTGDVLDYTRRYLLCGTHGALYELSTGRCVEGPCVGERLTALRVLRRAGRMIVEDPEG